MAVCGALLLLEVPPSPTRETVNSCCQLVPAIGTCAAFFVQNHHGHQDEQFPPSDLGGDISLLFCPVAFPQPEKETLLKSTPQKPRTTSQHRDPGKRIFHVDFIQPFLLPLLLDNMDAELLLRVCHLLDPLSCVRCGELLPHMTLPKMRLARPPCTPRSEQTPEPSLQCGSLVACPGILGLGAKL